VRSSLLSHGCCYVYVLPCAYEDILKLGFSRDPLGRLQSLHRRYFEFFDLDRAFLIETETVRDARHIEIVLGNELVLHNAPSPLVVDRSAGGHTEWYRGAYETLAVRTGRLEEEGYRVHRPARNWVRRALVAGSDRLHDWSNAMLEGLQDWNQDALASQQLRQTLLDALDAYSGMGIPLEPLLPPPVWRWYLHRGDVVRSMS